eukprot:TRINITY_DN65924_c0_g1_i2.p4 TRINITY_DN65924_c0_g1~~TRINITY_DN65924_c0_g1_i2.p4  ORF type:complete len:161 (-),score=8.08 TRINITY_DN65924_c0_g1_i2:439-861(-)
MSLRGVYQVTRISFIYCDWGGSSRGLRQFIEENLPLLKYKRPWIKFDTQVRRNKHPLLTATYKSGRFRYVSVKNCTPQEIGQFAYYLVNNPGISMRKNVDRFRTKRPSIQGQWTPELDLAGNFRPETYKKLLNKPQIESQ